MVSIYIIIIRVKDAQIAQSVEQETENLCVVGSIPSLGTTSKKTISMKYAKDFYEATDVNSSCFVFASAGSGKTKILVDRYVKSLFFGIKPQEILCITFTNAAVFEMESRISNILENLYLNENGFTEKYLKETFGLEQVFEENIKKAEGLFFEFQENLSQLKILTIHAFCQSLLQQFPLESGAFPNFEILDENEAIELLKNAKFEILKRTPETILQRLSRMISIHTLEDFVNRIYQLSPKFVELFNSYKSIENYKTHLSEIFKLTNVTEFSFEQIDFIKNVLKSDKLEELYLTKTGTIRKKIPFGTNDISKQISDIVFENSQINKKIAVIEKTCLFLELVKEILDEYQNSKCVKNVLDFSDVLYKTKFLLTESCAKKFVISKIHSQIKSIMIDEAQDLSSIQWELISIFSDDISLDQNTNKTIFVVGDIKQSIYRFQGANYRLFSDFYKYYLDVFETFNKNLKTVYLDTSYRTLPEILENVDNVFEGEIAKFSLNSDFIHYKKHIPYRKFQKGKFSLICINDDEEKAKKIASEIFKYKTDNSLILARSRSELSENVIKELLNLGVKIAPPDRVSLLNNLLIMDLLAIADICIDQNNDYALSCILKSQYFFEKPLTNEDLFVLCHNRLTSVFEKLKTHFPEKYKYIEKIISRYKENDVCGFFYYMTNLLKNISFDNENLIAGFLNEVSIFSKNESDNIPGFLNYFRSTDIEIINQNTAKTGLLLSTIHGSKGLEAVTVFMLDFDLNADKQKTKLLFLNESDFFKKHQTSPLFFIKPSQKDSFYEVNEIIENEYGEEKKELLRLLYVAMTRPRDNLYIFGQNNGKTAYSLIESKCLDMKEI